MSKKKSLVKHLKKALFKAPKLTDKEVSVLKTLWYKQIFDCPMSLYEISYYLIGEKVDSWEELKAIVNGLFRKDLVEFKSGKYYLKNTKDPNLNSKRNDSIEHIKTAELAVGHLSKIPWIKMICITGSVAALNANKNDDVDLFIVTERNRAWITRLLVVVTLKITNLYRTNTNYAGKICPNIIIDGSNLKWPEAKQTLYTANEIIMMRPIYVKDETYIKFIDSNSWIENYFPNFYWEGLVENPKTPKKLVLEFGFSKTGESKIINVVESLLRSMQKMYMYKKKTTEITKANLIHFNKVDWSTKILDEFSEFNHILEITRG